MGMTDPVYRRAIAILPTQLIGGVWGLGRHPRNVDLTLVSSDPTLMAMDAPDIIPIGSTWRGEQHFDDGIIYQEATTAYAPREGIPWENPLLAARKRQAC